MNFCDINKIEVKHLENKKSKLIHIELLRIIAVILVIFNHTGPNGYFLFSFYPFATRPYFIYMIFTVISKIDVPLFLMLTGALLLRKDMEPKKIIQKIVRMLIVLLIFTAIFYIRLHILKYSDTFTIIDFFIRLYKGDIIIPYWYIYAYISFLLAFPFLRAMVKSLPEKAYKYLIALAIIFVGILPCVEYRLFQGEVTLNQYGKVGWLFTNIVLFPLIGYYLENIIDILKVNKKNLLIACSVVLLGIAISCYMTYYKHRITGICTEIETQDFLDLFTVPICIAVFLLIKCWCNKVTFPNWINKIIISIGSCSFGIYLLHMAVIESKFISNLLNQLTNVLGFNCMISIWLLCLLTMTICYVITFVLKLIPGIKKLL